MKKGLFILFLVIAFALAVVASPGLSKRGKTKNPKPSTPPQPPAKGGNPPPPPAKGGNPPTPPASSDANFAKDSLSGAANGQVCDVSKIKTKANGTQLKNGGQSCSFTQIGEIPDVSQMVSSIITTPENGGTVKANTPFTVSVVSANLETGNFDDPETEYYKFSQQLNTKGFIKGHTHVTVQRLESTKSAPDARDPVFFKGLNNITKNSTLSVEVTPGLIPGIYRICTMTASFAHQPLIMPVAKRGAQDDCIRVTAA